MAYFLDGKPIQTVLATEFPHGEQNIWLTVIAAPLGGTKSVDDTLLPSSAECDYVRFYEKIPPAEETPGGSLTK